MHSEWKVWPHRRTWAPSSISPRQMAHSGGGDGGTGAGASSAGGCRRRGGAGDGAAGWRRRGWRGRLRGYGQRAHGGDDVGVDGPLARVRGRGGGRLHAVEVALLGVVEGELELRVEVRADLVEARPCGALAVVGGAGGARGGSPSVAATRRALRLWRRLAGGGSTGSGGAGDRGGAGGATGSAGAGGSAGRGGGAGAGGAALATTGGGAAFTSRSFTSRQAKDRRRGAGAATTASPAAAPRTGAAGPVAVGAEVPGRRGAQLERGGARRHVGLRQVPVVVRRGGVGVLPRLEVVEAVDEVLRRRRLGRRRRRGRRPPSGNAAAGDGAGGRKAEADPRDVVVAGDSSDCRGGGADGVAGARAAGRTS